MGGLWVGHGWAARGAPALPTRLPASPIHPLRCTAAPPAAIHQSASGWLTMGAGQQLMEMSTESPGRSSWRARPSKEQKALERESSGTCQGVHGRVRVGGGMQAVARRMVTQVSERPVQAAARVCVSSHRADLTLTRSVTCSGSTSGREDSECAQIGVKSRQGTPAGGGFGRSRTRAEAEGA